MKQIIAILILTFAFTGLAVKAEAQSNQPTLLKRTVNIKAFRYLRYWKTPTAAEPVYNTWSWVPKISFTVLGPISAGSQMYVEFDTPDGKPWISYKVNTPELEDDVMEIVRVNYPDENELEKKGITIPTGLFPFRIKIKNALNGTDTILMAGKYKMTTYTPDQSIPEYKGKKEFMVDQDWRLPMAWVWLNPQDDQTIPTVASQMWFHGTKGEQMEAFLFYNGKQIDSSKPSGSVDTLDTGISDAGSRYELWQFNFASVRGFNKSQSASDYSRMFFIDKNPGEYEVKVLRNNQLARSVKFTVGKDGKIVDNGFAASAKVGGVRMIFPAKIIGTADGAFNATAWQTDMLYSNPITGFVAQ